MMVLFFMLMIFLFVLIIGILLLYLVGLWKVFKKAGRNGWEAIIPFYNTWVLVEISGLAWWYALIIILASVDTIIDLGDIQIVLSIASIVANFFVFYNLSKKFHKDTGFAILLTFFPVVMIPLIGFSKDYQYDNDIVVSENGPINSNNQNDSSNYFNNVTNNLFNKASYCSNCGNKIYENENFCGICGNKIK